jgi:hypothetical protein
LGFNSEARAVLLLCRDTIVGNSPFHTNCIPPFAVLYGGTIRAMTLLNLRGSDFFSSCCTSERSVVARSRAKNAHSDSQRTARAISPSPLHH